MSRAKTAAEYLLKLAEELEKEAAEKTMFACEKCGHLETLASINSTVQKWASENKEAAEQVEVNDSIACNSCDDGKMAYAPTPDSEKFYVANSEETEEAEASATEPAAEVTAEDSNPLNNFLPKILANKDTGFIGELLKAIKAIKATVSAPPTPIGESMNPEKTQDAAHDEAALRGLKYLQQHGTPEEVAQYKKVMGLEHVSEMHTADSHVAPLDANDLYRLDPMALAAVVSAALDGAHLDRTIHELEAKLKASPATTLAPDTHSIPSHIPAPGPTALSHEASEKVSDTNINMDKLSKYLS